ncbi:MAG TPA: cytochrome c family protein [Gammaproteobacteria bacterium]|jgi:cytochrome c
MVWKLTAAAAAAAALGCSPAAPGGDAGMPAPSAAPTAAAFDVGPVKTAEEYLAEPAFAAADLERGEVLSLACVACHTFRAGEPALLGPNLSGVFGRRAATDEDFEYSQALRDARLTWTPRALDAWLANPSSFVPGTSMVFAGLSSAEDRRDLIAYLLRETQTPAE